MALATAAVSSTDCPVSEVIEQWFVSRSGSLICSVIVANPSTVLPPIVFGGALLTIVRWVAQHDCDVGRGLQGIGLLLFARKFGEEELLLGLSPWIGEGVGEKDVDGGAPLCPSCQRVPERRGAELWNTLYPDLDSVRFSARRSA